MTLQLAQTHAFTAPKRTWESGYSLQDGYSDLDLHLVGSRKALAIIEFGDVTPTNPRLSITHDASSAAYVIPLVGPDLLPKTYGDVNPTDAADGQPYSATAYSATIPAEYVQPGLDIAILDDVMAETKFADILVGASTHFEIVSMPLYFFGADPASTTHDGKVLTPEVAGKMSEDQSKEYMARLPVASFQSTLHPGRFLKSEYAVIEPRGGGSAYRCYEKADLTSGFDIISSGLNIIGALRELDGSIPLAKQYYASIIMQKKNGAYTDVGGGLGGGHIGAGDYSFGGIFFHEQGHAFGLPHARDDYSSRYPYENGGLKGSGWGYDEHLGKFIDVFYKKCTPWSQPTESVPPYRCYKQDVMQSGHEQRDEGLYYGLFSDFNNARIQRYFEGTELTNGRIFKNVTPAGGLARWDPETLKFVDIEYTGIDVTSGTDRNLVGAVLTFGCPELQCNSTGPLTTNNLNNMSITQIYPPFEYVGVTRELVDVDNLTQMDKFHWSKAVVDGRIERDYCDHGCDFVAAFEFENGSRSRIMVSKSFRSWRKPHKKIQNQRPEVMIPTDGSSYFVMAVAAEGSNVTRVDLLYAPMAWEGLHARVPQLVTSWVRGRGEVHPDSWTPEPSSPAHTILYDLRMPVPTSADHCNVSRSFGLIRAVETAVFSVVSEVSDRLPPLSRVTVKCMCAAPTCPENCEKDYEYPDPDFPASPPVERSNDEGSLNWQPDCGCQISGFDANVDGQDSCTASGGIHQSRLTRVDYAPGVYYYVNDVGRGMMVQESETIREDYSYTLDEVIERCRSEAGCGMVQFEINHASNKTALLKSRCMSPCYKVDYWNRIGYHVDFDNLWASTVAQRNAEGGALTFRVEVHVPTNSTAYKAHMRLSPPDDATTAISTLLAGDEAFTRGIPWAFDASEGMVHGKLSDLVLASPPTPPPSPPSPSTSLSQIFATESNADLSRPGFFAMLVLTAMCFLLL